MGYVGFCISVPSSELLSLFYVGKQQASLAGFYAIDWRPPSRPDADVGGRLGAVDHLHVSLFHERIAICFRLEEHEELYPPIADVVLRHADPFIGFSLVANLFDR